MMITPMAASMPWTTDGGITEATTPARVRAMTIWMIAATTPMARARRYPRTGSPIPSSLTAPRAMTMSPAAGPLIVSSALPRNETITPPMMAVITPAIGGKPLAIEIPRHSGSAIKNTSEPDNASALRLWVGWVM